MSTRQYRQGWLLSLSVSSRITREKVLGTSSIPWTPGWHSSSMWKSYHPCIPMYSQKISTSHDTWNINPETSERTEHTLLLHRLGTEAYEPVCTSSDYIQQREKQCWFRSNPGKHLGNLNPSISKFLRAWLFNLTVWVFFLNKVELPKEMRQGNKAELIYLCSLTHRWIFNKLGREARVSQSFRGAVHSTVPPGKKDYWRLQEAVHVYVKKRRSAEPAREQKEIQPQVVKPQAKAAVRQLFIVSHNMYTTTSHNLKFF